MNANKQTTKWVRLGDYIERSMVNNNDLKYGPEFIFGVNSDGEFCESKANTYGINLKPYKIVHDGDFVYNPSRLNIGSLALRKGPMCIVSHLYVVFHLNAKGKEIIKNEYLELFFKRKEFQRMVTYLNFGSQRPEFNFFEMSEIRIPLPTPDIQQELIDTYNGLKSLAEENEALIDPLRMTFEAVLMNYKSKYQSEKIGPYIQETKEVNTSNKYGIDDACGVNTNKEIQDAKRVGEKLNTYKIIHDNDIVFNMNIKMSSLGDKFAVALNKRGNRIVSNFYVTFKVKDTNKILPEYILLWLIRDNFADYVKFISCATVRETFTYNDLADVEIPIPPIDIQKSIVNLYNCLEQAKSIAKEARQKQLDICPALIQKAIHS